MAADGVQDDESVFFDVGDIFLEVVEKDLIEAALSVAITWVVAFVNLSGGDTIADFLATVVIFQPEDVEARLLEEIHQIFRVSGIVGMEVFPCHIGEHAGY